MAMTSSGRTGHGGMLDTSIRRALENGPKCLFPKRLWRLEIVLDNASANYKVDVFQFTSVLGALPSCLSWSGGMLHALHQWNRRMRRQQMITDTLKLHRLPHTYIHYERPGGSIDHLQLSRLPMSYKCAIQSAFCGHRSNNAFNIWD